MKLNFLSIVFISLILSGCVMRVAQREVDRVDQELIGNRGVLTGEPSQMPTERKKTREFFDVEIEVGPSAKDIQTKPVAAQDYPIVQEAKTPPPSQPKARLSLNKPTLPIALKPAPARASEAEKKPVKFYVVSKDDTLQKISKKVYGTTKNWKKLYEANKNTLKNPNRIMPGQKLVIPE